VLSNDVLVTPARFFYAFTEKFVVPPLAGMRRKRVRKLVSG